MFCKLSPERTLLLDKLIRTTKSEFLTFEIDSIFQIQLITADLSHMTLIKLESHFFDEFVNERSLLFSIPTRRFYESNMKELNMRMMDDRRIVFEYYFKEAKYIKTVEYLEAEVFDLQFEIKKSVEMEGSMMKRMIGEIKGKEMKIRMTGRMIRMEGGNVEIESTSIYDNDTDDKTVNREFKIDVEKLKNVIQITDQFYNCRINFTEEESPVNIVFESPEMTMSTFISTG